MNPISMESAQNGKSQSILILDDDENPRQILIDEFQKIEYCVIEFSSKRDGLAWIKKHQVDLDLSDINSPHMDGFEFLRLLRANVSAKGIPLIFATGLAGIQAVLEASRLGAGSIGPNAV